jgi:hypothetical protein
MKNKVTTPLKAPIKALEDTQKFLPTTRGAPSKYRPEMCNIVIQVANDGGFHAAMMVACGIGNDTFYRWKKEIPEFKEAVDQADLISLALQEAVLVDGMLGKIKNYNFNANAMILNNKWRAHYARVNSSGGDTNIEITNNTINLSKDEIDNKIAQVLERLKKSGTDYTTNLIEHNPVHEDDLLDE